MIYDMMACLGTSGRQTAAANPEALARLLGTWDIEKVYAGRIDDLFQENGNLADRPVAPVRFGKTTIVTVPVIDPTLPNWAEMLAEHRDAAGHELPLVRVHPSHHGYAVDDESVVGPLVEWTHRHGTVLQVILGLDDSRRRHPAVKLQDVPLGSVAKLAKRFPHQKFLTSGGLFAAVAGLAKDRPANLWVDTARIEAAAGLPRLFEAGWGDRLVFSSFAPLLIVHSAIARVLADLNDEDASRVFYRNAQALLAAE